MKKESNTETFPNRLKIHWFQTNLTNLSAEHDTYFYAFSRGNSILYIGKSHLTTLHKEVKQNLNRLKISNIGLVIWVGFVTDTTKTNHQDIGQLVDDAESLLIFRNPTQLNDKKTKSYRGIVPFKVVSDGCPYLKKTITISTSSILNRK